jgi:hypothetical protein
MANPPKSPPLVRFQGLNTLNFDKKHVCFLNKKAIFVASNKKVKPKRAATGLPQKLKRCI